MKWSAILFLIASMLLIGAGCSSKSNSVASQPSPVKQALIQRRTSDPPKPPENVPAPTPVHPTGTAE